MTKLSISQVLYLILGIQIFVSIMTVLLDVEYRWLRYFDQTEIRYGPVEPGDQRRLFEPKKSKPEIFPDQIERQVERESEFVEDHELESEPDRRSLDDDTNPALDQTRPLSEKP